MNARRLLHFGVTAHPSAEWIARQITEACGWGDAPQYLVRDRDRVYGVAFTRASCHGHSRQTNSVAIALAERSFRTAGRLDQTGVPRPRRHPRRTAPARCAPLLCTVYNAARTHLSLAKDAPVPRAVQAIGTIFRCRSLANCTTIMFGSDFR
jgi:hypothetical protein